MSHALEYRSTVTKEGKASSELKRLNTKASSHNVANNSRPVKNFNWASMLATCVSLMATWEAFCSTMASGLLSGGPVSLIYGYILAFMGTLATTLSLAEAASMQPTAGGQYHFVAVLAPPRFSRGLSWAAGWITMFGWQAVAASAPFLAGTMIQGLIALNHPEYVFERWHGTLLYWAVLLVALVANTIFSSSLPLIEHLTMVLHITLFFVILISVVVASPTKHSAAFVFSQYVNSTGWESNGVAWCIGMLSAAYVLVGYDGATHLSEEMIDASIGVPRAMIGSIIINGLMGFGFIIAILFSMGDLDTVLSTQYGFPIIQIFLNATSGNVRAATAMSSAVVLMASLATIPLILSAARTLWALARDKAFPFASTLSRLDERKGIPTIAVCVTTGFLALLGLLNIASTSAFNAILSLSVVGLYASYLMAVLAILYARLATPTRIVYGPFRLGRFGIGVNIVSIVYTIFTMIFLLFPPYLPVTAVNMNYACVILSGVLVFSFIYWLTNGRKLYFGPMDVGDVIVGRTMGNATAV